MNEDETSNFQLLRDCLATPLVEKAAVKEKPQKKIRKAKYGRKTIIKPAFATEEPNDAEELAEFIDVRIRVHSFKTTVDYS